DPTKSILVRAGPRSEHTDLGPASIDPESQSYFGDPGAGLGFGLGFFFTSRFPVSLFPMPQV
ncbi:hypothetical protein, partial [Terracidiphilus sp.]|uniref:hypothetical protein n=1 Tax=Terracidiphilus sp. TaxID=1964191 RepID=UPI003C219E66